jgi:hypothetical protein
MGISISCVLFEMLGSVTLDHGISLLAALFGALAGAWTAYKLASDKESKKLAAQKLQSLIKCEASLLIQWNTMVNIKRDYLDPNRHYLKSQDIINPNFIFYNTPSVPLDELSFIALSSNANLWQSVTLAQQNFDSFIGCMTKLADRIDEEHRRIDVTTGSYLQSASYYYTKNLTDSMYQSYEDTMRLGKEARKELKAYLKKHYGKVGLSHSELDGQDEATSEVI